MDERDGTTSFAPYMTDRNKIEKCLKPLIIAPKDLNVSSEAVRIQLAETATTDALFQSSCE